MRGPPKTGHDIACDQCGVMFYAKAYELAGYRRYCSRACLADSKRTAYQDTWLDRFWSRVEKGAGCWEWRGPRLARGYGVASIRARSTSAHRVAWELAYGPIPDGMVVRHAVCDNPGCVKATGDPAQDHLRLGAPKDNSADMVAHGRSMLGIPKTRGVCRGSANAAAKLSEDDVLAIRAAAAAGATMKDIATRAGVPYPRVWAIVRRRQWTHI